MDLGKLARTIKNAGRTEFSLIFFSAVLGVLVTALLTSQSKPAPDWLLFLGLVVLLTAVSVLIVKIDDVRRAVFHLAEKSTGGVRFLDKNDISTIGSEEIARATVIRALGTARQDVLLSNVAARSYVQATEKRLRQREPLIYRRITSQYLRRTFAEHLIALLELAGDSKSSVEVALIPNIESTVSYQVIDETSVLVVIDSPTIPGIRDYSFAFISSEIAIVKAFIAHFDHAWSKLETIRDKETLTCMAKIVS